jgi:Dolichyl-phosphate-mannose-protein mannosyltransferase
VYRSGTSAQSPRRLTVPGAASMLFRPFPRRPWLTEKQLENATKTAPRRWPALLWLGLATVATLIVYKDLPRATFFLDDYLHLHLIQKFENPFVPFFTDIFMGAFFRPAISIFWSLDLAMFGDNPAGFYVMNILYLLVSVGLLYAIMHHLTGSNTQSGLLALLFALGPVTGIGVQWLSNRFDLIGTLFFLLSLLWFLRWARWRRRGEYVLSLGAAIIAFFCKEITITLPAAMVLSAGFMFLYRAPQEFNGRLVKRLVSWSTPFFTVAALFMIWRFVVIGSLGGYAGEIKESFTLGYMVFLWQHFGEYVWLVKNPFVLAALLIITAFLLAKPNFYARNKLFFFGLLFTLVTIAPLAMVFRYRAVMGFMTPRFFFLPNIGVIICLVALYDPRSSVVRRVFAGIVLGLVGLSLGLNTYVLNHKWYRDKIELTEQMAQIEEVLSNGNIADGQSAMIYTCLPNVDVAIDTGVKFKRPDLVEKYFVLKCTGPTQTIASKDLYHEKRRLLNFPETFARNPCTYEDIIYGVAEAKPRTVMDQIRSVGGVYVLDLDKDGNMVLLERDSIYRMINVRFGIELAEKAKPNA